jgi:hypothetical protein
MKKIIVTFIVLIAGGVLLVYSAIPNVPEVNGTPDYDAGADCLSGIPTKYDPDFFTYKAWAKVWFAHYADKLGIKLTPSLQSYYTKYIDLQLDVDCYVILSNNSDLNMALSPNQFKAVYNAIADHHEFEKIR